jgi:hypothetical protein
LADGGSGLVVVVALGAEVVVGAWVVVVEVDVADEVVLAGPSALSSGASAPHPTDNTSARAKNAVMNWSVRFI